MKGGKQHKFEYAGVKKLSQNNNGRFLRIIRGTNNINQTTDYVCKGMITNKLKEMEFPRRTQKPILETKKGVVM